MTKTFSLLLLVISTHSFSQNVGIGNNAPQEKLEVSGAVKIGNTTAIHPGTIRYGADNLLKGNEGSGWKSLVTAGSSYSFGGFVSNVRNSDVRTPYSITAPDDGQYLIILTTDMENSQNYSGNKYDTHGYIYLRLGTSTVLTHHALKNEMEVYSTGYTISLVPAEFPKIVLSYLSKNDVLVIDARLDSFGSPAPTSNWSIYSLNIILVKLN
ncbi:MAG: hypothetical protein JWQ09_4812 [Segetibacter sp.]|nr:hypothetical protein [Segetibacter sp.]